MGDMKLSAKSSEGKEAQSVAHTVAKLFSLSLP